MESVIAVNTITASKVAISDTFVSNKMDNFVTLYTKYATESCDAPKEFQTAMAYFTIGAVLGRQLWFPLGHRPVYPNFWICLIARSSLSRKSTSLYISRNMIHHVKPLILAPGDFTREAMFDWMETQPNAIFYHSEFMAFLGMLNSSYNEGLKAFLTDLYDCDDSYTRTTKQRTQTIKQPFPCIGTATTLDWFLKENKEDDFRAGFLARFLFIPGEFSRLEAIPKMPNDTLFRQCLLALKSLTNVRGPVSIDKQGETMYRDWFADISNKIEKAPPITQPVLARLHTIAWKVALCNCAMRGSNVMSSGDIADATQFCNYIIRNFLGLYEREFAFTPFEKATKRVVELITRRGSIGRSELFNHTGYPKNFVDKILESLAEGNRIKVERERIGESKKPSVIYKLVK